MNWNKVTEKLPEIGKMVWAFGKNWRGLTHFDGKDWRFGSNICSYANSSFCYVDGVTHWQELPVDPVPDDRN